MRCRYRASSNRVPVITCRKQNNYVIICIVILSLVVGASTTDKTQIKKTCMTARQHCQSKLGCGAAYTNYLTNCLRIHTGETTVCSMSCKEAIISLLSSEDSHGINLINCDCENNSMCIDQKKLMSVCNLTDLIRSIGSITDNHTIIDCSLAKWACEADTTCHAALLWTYERCYNTFKGKECTPACKNSLDILYSRPKANKLRRCNCLGSEHIFGYGIECDRLKYYTEKLCYDRLPYRHTTPQSHNNSVKYNIVSSALHLQCNSILLTLSLLFLLRGH